MGVTVPQRLASSPPLTHTHFSPPIHTHPHTLIVEMPSGKERIILLLNSKTQNCVRLVNVSVPMEEALSAGTCIYSMRTSLSTKVKLV